MATSNSRNNLLAVVIGVIIAIVIVEIFGRVAPLNTGFRAGMPYLDYHPAMGWQLDASVGSIPYESNCLSIDKVTIGADGNRVVPLAPQYPEHTIAVLGDSFMMAREMSDGEHFSAVLANELPDARVTNYGVAGYGLLQSYLTYREKSSASKPDITILSFFDANDVMESSRELTVGDRLQSLRPFFDPETRELQLSDRADWDAMQNPPPLLHLHNTLRNYSFTYHAVITYIAAPLRALLKPEPAAAGMAAEAPPGSAVMPQPQASPAEGYWWQRKALYQNMAVYQAPPDEIWERAWKDTELALTRLNKDVQADGGRLVIMTIPSVGVMWLLQGLDAYARDFGAPAPPGFDTRYPARRLAELGAKQGFDVVDLTPVFEDYMARHPMERRSPFYYTCDGHWNPLAHYLAAQSIADHLALTERPAGVPWLAQAPETLLGAEAAQQIYDWGEKYYGYSAIDTTRSR